MELQDLIRLREVCQYILIKKPSDMFKETFPTTMSPEFFQQYYNRLCIKHNITKDSDLEDILEQCLKDIEIAAKTVKQKNNDNICI